MGTYPRADISKKNKYFIGREKYYELKHFCRQYPEWVKAYITFAPKTTQKYSEKMDKTRMARSTEGAAELLLYFKEKMDLVDQTLDETDPFMAKYLKIGVTEGYSYEFLKTTMDIPIGRDAYYELYRKFFWLLAKKR